MAPGVGFAQAELRTYKAKAGRILISTRRDRAPHLQITPSCRDMRFVLTATWRDMGLSLYAIFGLRA